jgi:hypothetical protein
MGKKRKLEVDIEAERSLYSSFVQAANAVSQLYTQGVQQQRRSAAAASKATLERVVTFVLRQEEGSETISKAALLQFLQHEYENADSSDATTPQPQMQFMPFQQAAAAASEDTADTHPHLHKAHRQQSGNSMMTSPAGRTASAGRLVGMDEQQQHYMQQHQQQQHVPQQAADAMQVHGGVMHMAAGGPFAGAMQQPAMAHGMFMAPPGAGGMH